MVPFDPRLDRAQIILPKVFSLTTDYSATMHVIEQMRVLTLSERRPIMLHFTTVEVIEPAAALVLVAEIDLQHPLGGKNLFQGTHPKHTTTTRLLSEHRKRDVEGKKLVVRVRRSGGRVNKKK